MLMSCCMGAELVKSLSYALLVASCMCNVNDFVTSESQTSSAVILK